MKVALGGTGFVGSYILDKLIREGYNTKLIAQLFERFDWFPVTRDQLTILFEGNTVEKQYFSDFDIKPIKFERKNLSYLM